MKTITLKADERFDALLKRLAERTYSSKSAVIREAVARYQRQLDRDELRERLRAVSLLTREQGSRIRKDLENANADGL